MAIQSYTEQLEEVQAAISAVLAGQEYQIGTRRLKRADLEMLTEREKFLRAMIERENGTRTLAGWGG